MVAQHFHSDITKKIIAKIRYYYFFKKKNSYSVIPNEKQIKINN